MPVYSTNTYQSQRWIGSCPGKGDSPELCNVDEGPMRDGYRLQKEDPGFRKDVDAGPRREGCRCRTKKGMV